MSSRFGTRTAAVAVAAAAVVGVIGWVAASSTAPHDENIGRSTLTAPQQQRPPLQRASQICFADSNDGLLDYTNSYGVDSLFAMSQLMMNASRDLLPLASGAPTVATQTIRDVQSALVQAADAEGQILAKMPPPPAVPDTLVVTAARAVASLDQVTARDNLPACEFKVSEATLDRWAKVVPPPS
jgi:hypothetical protein